jgi:hypothetical protein
MKLLTILAVLLASVMPASAGPSSDAWFGKLTGEYQCQGGWRNTGITVQFRKYATKANEISLSGALAMVDERYDLNLRGRKDVINSMASIVAPALMKDTNARSK